MTERRDAKPPDKDPTPTRMRRNPPAVLALTRALTAIRAKVLPATAEQRAELRSMVCALTDELKQAGAPPERVVIKLRAVARAAGFDGFADALVSEAVRWCLEQYFPGEVGR